MIETGTFSPQAENQANRLRRYLLNQMLLTGNSRIDVVSTKISLCKKQPKVMISCDYSELPPEYVKVEYTPKLAEIKRPLKADAQSVIGWAHLSQSEEFSLTIR